jgi:hypothetical protein
MQLARQREPRQLPKRSEQDNSPATRREVFMGPFQPQNLPDRPTMPPDGVGTGAIQLEQALGRKLNVFYCKTEPHHEGGRPIEKDRA